MPILKANPTLKDFQGYVRQLEKERGFSEDTILHKCLFLGEELGELFRAIRKQQKMKTDANSKYGTVDEELADMLIYIFAIANRFNIDLEGVFREKEEVNKNRTWK
ncbi:MAG: MazG nucleotide pyrophosphohydrolase domain-containing protein [Candidatus Nanoarchaeia archaeon]|nr:MazG nucleotide pyrophosphohydrolase domain-containing protein [Candidatus Nanoarchaeia archaeon]MDD5238885.1 MazG nucleotide pyrophosphohydrolase domain-containing protein [Candidatus Nanoarchaeia archaeon]